MTSAERAMAWLSRLAAEDPEMMKRWLGPELLSRTTAAFEAIRRGALEEAAQVADEWFKKEVNRLSDGSAEGTVIAYLIGDRIRGLGK